MTHRYKHTFEIYISLESGDEIDALQKRLDAFKEHLTHAEMIEECGLIDTYEVQPREVTK